ncbi:LysR substrate-binding domain-containing protein [Veronia pacifica]|uniref:LysR substrate-binding domain-containing protein n=1 Tax=Veronia pacifica TaxID=1080227 RepID=UPI0024815001|nr:LysR substrate-binding domain-containing protein [Veronia pacifica]
MDVSLSSKITVNNVEVMTELASQRVGIATPPSFLAKPLLASGKVIELLTEWQVEPIPYHLIWPGQNPENTNTRRLINFLLEKVQGPFN